MSLADSYVAIAVALVASTWCWWHIRRSGDPAIIKIVLSLIAAVPFLGAILYVLIQLPPRRRPLPPAEGSDPRRPSALVARWHEREHVYLGWASAVFWGCAGLAYWMNDWKAGAIHYFPWGWGHFTDVDVLFHALLIGAVLTFGLAVRAKVILERELRGAFTLHHQRHLETQ